MKILALILCGTSLAAATEVAVLHSGARLRAERVERDGSRVILHQAEGRIELDATLVAAVEVEPEPEPVPAAPLPSLPPPVLALKPTRELVTEAANRYGLPPEIVHSVAAVESAYRADAVSPKGAIGVMQLMPETARFLNADPHNLAENIDAGTRLLRDLLLRFQNEPNPVRRALAAYNAGEGAVRRYNGVPPYRETQAYVEKVLERYWRLAGKTQR
jgi:soluble lytic murein transglycosylase-like protein